MTREVPAITPTKYKATERKDGPIRAFRPQVLVAREGEGPARRRAESRGIRRHAPAHARLPERGRAARRPHSRREEHSVGARDQSRRRHVQGRGGADRALRQDEQAQEEQADDRLLPHRRAQQPHVVRAQVPARLQERQELRRVLDGVGQFGRGSRSRNERSCKPCSTRSRCSPIRRTARICCSTTRSSSRTSPRRSRRGRSPRIISCPHCESEAYVWAEPQADGTLKLYFAVENPVRRFGQGAGGDPRQVAVGSAARGNRDRHAGHRRADLSPEHLDGQRTRADVDGAGRADPGRPPGEVDYAHVEPSPRRRCRRVSRRRVFVRAASSADAQGDAGDQHGRGARRHQDALVRRVRRPRSPARRAKS